MVDVVSYGVNKVEYKYVKVEIKSMSKTHFLLGGV